MAYIILNMIGRTAPMYLCEQIEQQMSPTNTGLADDVFFF